MERFRMTPLTRARASPGPRAATWPRPDSAAERLLEVDVGTASFRDRLVEDLPSLLAPGDLLVVNDAATLPASLFATAPSGDRVEIRLLGENAERGTFGALLFGAGDWRTPTERRPAPPELAAGTLLRNASAPELAARIVAVDERAPRFVELRFSADRSAFWPALYRSGRPIQYSHVSGPLELWHVQTRFGSRPWASELPSAGRPLSWELLLGLRRRGVEIAHVTHAAGLSSTGSPELDRLLPRAERYEIPGATASAVEQTRRTGGRVIAVGTTVVRALEAAASLPGGLGPRSGVAELVIGPGFTPRVVDGIFTGQHEPSTSHFALLEAFAPRKLLEAAFEHAVRAGYLHHEFGDSWLVRHAKS
jgi:S-adenosylmethionine:tRNA ribosyltransferase-isomerase